MGHVLDASALLKLVLDAEGHASFRTWFREQVRSRAELAAPHLLWHEAGSVLQREFADLDPADRATMHADLVRAVQLLDVPAEAAFQHGDDGLTFYHGAYLALAEARADTLVTGDGALATLAEARGVRVRRV